jgi:uncharacterized membrane protein
MNARTRSDWRIVVTGVAALLAAIVLTARPDAGRPASASTAGVSSAVSDAQVYAILDRRCTTCHSEHPSNPSFPEAPSGVKLDRPELVALHSQRIQARAIDTRTMPLGNLTGMTDAERDTLAAWLRGRR